MMDLNQSLLDEQVLDDDLDSLLDEIERDSNDIDELSKDIDNLCSKMDKLSDLADLISKYHDRYNLLESLVKGMSRNQFYDGLYLNEHVSIFEGFVHEFIKCLVDNKKSYKAVEKKTLNRPNIALDIVNRVFNFNIELPNSGNIGLTLNRIDQLIKYRDSHTHTNSIKIIWNDDFYDDTLKLIKYYNTVIAIIAVTMNEEVKI